MINKITVSNWMGHENFSAEFKDGKNLVFGNNAAGKTSLAKAIAYCLTGKMPLPKSCDPRRDKNKDTLVELVFTAPDKKNYLIRRQLNKGSRLRDDIFIYDELNLTEALYTSSDAEDFLQKMIGLSSEIFERIIYMKEEDVHEFLAKPGGGVLEEIDRLIGLEKAHEIGDIIEDIKSKLSYAERLLKDDIKITDGAIQKGLGVKKGSVNVKKVETRIDEIATTVSELLLLKGFFDEDVRIGESFERIFLEANESTTKDLEKNLIKKQINSKKEKEGITKEINSHEKEQESIKEEMMSFRVKSDLKKDILQDLKKDKDSGTISDCPTCGREIDPKTIASILKKLRKEIDTLSEEANAKLESIRSADEELDLKNRKMKQLESKIENLERLKNETSKLQDELKSNNSSIKQFDGKKYPQKIDTIEKLLDKLDQEERKLRDDLARAEGAKQVSDERLTEIRKLEEQAKHRKKVANLILTATQEATRSLREEYTDSFKNLAESIWEQYKGERWQLDWDKKFVPIAKRLSTDKTLTAYEMSGSEKFLIFLAIRLAILQSLEQFQLLIIDEPCQHLDEINGVIFRDILTSIDKEKIKQSIVFTYNQDFLDGKWANVIKLSE
ncbi:MAG: AAA family ATPase [Candidatus Heimdallarchaeota archaeon]|nr:AAA family ATPase [Candidatus Heimdallarchaeota archaeon]